MRAMVRVVATAMVGGVLLSACASRRAELEYEKPVTTVWSGKEPPRAAETTEAPPAGASPATRVPVASPATSTTVPRPTSWVRPDPVTKR